MKPDDTPGERIRGLLAGYLTMKRMIYRNLQGWVRRMGALTNMYPEEAEGCGAHLQEGE